MPPFITLTGQSGRDYVFAVLPLNRKPPDSAGVYVVTNTIPDSDGQIYHAPLQIGSCDDLSKLFDTKENLEMQKDGLKRICIKIEEIVEKQQQIKNDLSEKYNC